MKRAVYWFGCLLESTGAAIAEWAYDPRWLDELEKKDRDK